MPSPPRRGVGRRCTRRPPGASTADRRRAATRTISVALSEASTASTKQAAASAMASGRLAAGDPLVEVVEAVEHGLHAPRLAHPLAPRAPQALGHGAVAQQGVEPRAEA